MVEILFANVVILLISYFLERSWKKSHRKSLQVKYDKIKKLVPKREEELLEDLRKKTGLDITGYEIERINLNKETARIRIYYRD